MMTGRYVQREKIGGSWMPIGTSLAFGETAVREHVKKVSRRLRPIERKLRKLIRVEYGALGEHLVPHERSRRKRRNGEARDIKSNLVKVIRQNS